MSAIEPPDPVASADVDAAAPRRRLLVLGLTWTAAYQLVEVALNFASMLVLVRILRAADYGRAAAVTGLLALLNTFNAHLFVEHALQQPDGHEPDWQLHWTAAFYIQLALSLAANAIAVLCWFSTDYRPMAGLLHLAAFGLIVDAASLLRAAMLRRQLDLQRLRLVGGVAMSLRLIATVGLALAGVGAYALVIGNNVMPALVFAIDLFLFARWMPAAGWYRRRWWSEYSAQAVFGLMRAGAQLIATLRSAIEAMLLPVPLGFAMLGLINRAQLMYANTFGRVGFVIADVVYPFLPRSSKDPERFASHATLYLQVMMLVSIPAALFVAEHGPLLSRVLYGSKWIEMDPLIRPGSIVGLAVSLLGTTSAILMAAGFVRECLVLDGFGAAGAAPALVVAWWRHDAVAYSWTCAGVEAVVAVAAMFRAARLLKAGWFGRAVLPPLVSATVALLFLRFCPMPFLAGMGVFAQLAIVGSAYAIVNLAVLRLAFLPALEELLAYVPASQSIRRLIRLRSVAPPLAPSVAPEL